jgi:hypothetical protein
LEFLDSKFLIKGFSIANREICRDSEIEGDINRQID